MKASVLNSGKIKQIPFLPQEEGPFKWGNKNIPLYTCVYT